MKLWTTAEDRYPSPPPTPELTRESCLSSKGIRSFLKLSRMATDDVLKQRLNASLNAQDVQNVSKEEICNTYISTVLFPAWEQRAKAISFCDNESNSLRKEIADQASQPKKETEYNLRLDPYAERDDSYNKHLVYVKVDELKNWINNEKDIERIVKDRSIELLNDSCNSKNWYNDFFKSCKK